MTRQVRAWAIAALAVVALAGAAAPSFAGITYNVTNDLTHQNGWSLAGTITVSGAGTFTSASDITAFDITASKDSVSYNYSNTTSTTSPSRTLLGTLNATSTTLSLAANSLLYFSEDSANFSLLYWTNGHNGFTTYLGGWASVVLWESNAAPVFSPIVDGAWTLGTRSAAVPEIDPATGGSALSLVAGVLAIIEQRRRRAMLVA